MCVRERERGGEGERERDYRLVLVYIDLLVPMCMYAYTALSIGTQTDFIHHTDTNSLHI